MFLCPKAEVRDSPHSHRHRALLVALAASFPRVGFSHRRHRVEKKRSFLSLTALAF